MNTDTVERLGVNAHWLENDVVTTMTTTNGMNGAGGETTYYYQQWYPYWTYPVHISTSPARPIKLSLSEIEKLRKVARADKSVRDILAKFTDLIEITVDFK